ncbi:MAG: hypothetical protein ACK4QL_03380 [Pseudanabaenaceae cyanobacterium]
MRPRKLERVTGSSPLFDLPNGDRRAPDVAFVKAEKLPQTTKVPAEVVPNLIVSDSRSKIPFQPLEFLGKRHSGKRSYSSFPACHRPFNSKILLSHNLLIALPLGHKCNTPPPYTATAPLGS